MDVSWNIGVGPVSAKVGNTIIINVVDGYVAEYSHTGLGTGISAIPVSCSKTYGQVLGDMSNPKNYSGLFLERSYSFLLSAGDAYSIDGNTLGAISQGGLGTEINWAIGETINEYNLVDVYNFN